MELYEEEGEDKRDRVAKLSWLSSLLSTGKCPASSCYAKDELSNPEAIEPRLRLCVANQLCAEAIRGAEEGCDTEEEAEKKKKTKILPEMSPYIEDGHPY